MIKAFMHVVDFPGTEFIVLEMIDKMVESDFINNADITITCQYNQQSFQWLRDKVAPYPRVTLVYPDTKNIDFEMPTQKMLKDCCDSTDEEFYVVYLQHKGATQPHNPCVSDWRDLMVYFNITKWRDCVAKLDEGYDTTGVLWRPYPYPHYSGTFWWAKASYIRKLPKYVLPEEAEYKSQFGFGVESWPYGYRHDAEFWIALAHPKQHCFHTSDSEQHPIYNHYHLRYPKESYVDC